uniref:Uncharacterized protein n=1 Tax=Spironucleus salmonicida TaxID=348837 RepID=V6LKT6_9EUKA|eukprot:EST44351.1 Hypothetical protein SS50377_15778 [Spironucleus salmonicida]
MEGMQLLAYQILRNSKDVDVLHANFGEIPPAKKIMQPHNLNNSDRHRYYAEFRQIIRSKTAVDDVSIMFQDFYTFPLRISGARVLVFNVNGDKSTRMAVRVLGNVPFAEPVVQHRTANFQIFDFVKPDRKLLQKVGILAYYEVLDGAVRVGEFN